MNALRERQQRNFLTTLLLSQGVPMLLGGDELSRTQNGNNNAWCQDNEISWFDWDLGDAERRLLEFARRVIFLRRTHPVFRRNRFFAGSGEDLPDVWWMRPDGRKMTQRDWKNDGARAIAVFLNGDELNATTARGEEVQDESFLVLFNAHHEPLSFRLPTRRFGARWKVELSTAGAGARGGSGFLDGAPGAHGRVAVDPGAASRLVRCYERALPGRSQHLLREGKRMSPLLLIVIVLLVLFAIGGGAFVSNLLWLLLIVALIVLVVGLVSGRRAV